MINRMLIHFLQLISLRAYARVGPPPPSFSPPPDPPPIQELPFPTTEPPRIGPMIDAVVFFVGKIGPAIGLFAFGMVIYGGYLWIVSGGEPQKKQKAQATLTWSIAGLAFFYLIKMFLNWVLDWVT